MRSESVGQTVVVCFVVGTRNVNNTQLASLVTEHAHHHDLLLLPRVAERGKLSVSKALAFWQAAARRLVARYDDPTDGLFPRAPLVGKTDDDAFVNIPAMLHVVATLRCVPHAY